MNNIPIARYLSAGWACSMQVALLVGYLADTMERRTLFVVVVLLGEVPCLLTYWVTQYWQLLLLRCLTGISIGGTCSTS